MKTVTAAVVQIDGLVLLTRRAQGEKLAGYWEFPGGKVDPGETLHSCLRRELLEELGVSSNPGSIICESVYKYDHGEFRLVAMDTTLEGADFTLSVHDKAEWVEISKLLDYQLAPADIPIARRIVETSRVPKT
jgi:8-oxo-dGTP diphosphatase